MSGLGWDSRDASQRFKQKSQENCVPAWTRTTSGATPREAEA